MFTFQSFGYDRAAAPSKWSRRRGEIRLGNGTHIFIRPIELNDGEAIRSIYSNLSPGSKYMRFNTNLGVVAPTFLQRLSQQIAHKAHYSGYGLLAYHQGAADQQPGLPIGMGCYIETEPKIAELELTVTDAWQGLGLGYQLLNRLAAHARKGPYQIIEAYVNRENRPMQTLISKAEPPHRMEEVGTMLRFQLLIS